MIKARKNIETLLSSPASQWGGFEVGVLLLACLVPGAGTVAHAEVQISEVAWMGSAEDANAEWIELHNTGESVDVTGWTLVAADGQPSITLEGTVPAGSYALLERTDDETVPGVTAFQVYTGALGNAGEVLVLSDAQGTMVDRVDGGENWALGGDNNEKLSLQRAGSTWVTAQPTPGRTNATVSTPVAAPENTTENTSGTSASYTSGTNTNTSSKSGAASSKATVATHAPAEPSLTLNIGADRTVAIGTTVECIARTTSETGKNLGLDSVRWNFGDGTTAKGRTVTHRYEYEGDYIVTAHAVRTVLHDDIVADARLVVHVREAPVVISSVDTLSIQLTNTSTRDVDLSGFLLVAGEAVFRVPDGTGLLAGASVRLPAQATKLVVSNPNDVALFYPNSTRAAWYGDTRMEGDRDVTGQSTALRAEGVDDDLNAMTLLAEDVPEEGTPVLDQTPAEPAELLDPPVANTVQSGVPAALAYAVGQDGTTGGAEAATSLWWYLLGLGATMLVASVSVVLIRREQVDENRILEQEVARYEIEER